MIFAPCPTGWGTPMTALSGIGTEVVDCGLWYLAEYENGEFVLNRNPKELRCSGLSFKAGDAFSAPEGRRYRADMGKRVVNGRSSEKLEN